MRCIYIAISTSVPPPPLIAGGHIKITYICRISVKTDIILILHIVILQLKGCICQIATLECDTTLTLIPLKYVYISQATKRAI